MRLRSWFVLSLLFSASALSDTSAQALVKEEYRSQIARILDQAAAKSTLPCNFNISQRPRLDFLFRYVGDFEIACKLADPIVPGGKLTALMRITPEQGSPTLMVEEYDLPQLPQLGANSMYAKPSQLRIMFIGGFALGQGRYTLEIVLIDKANHMCRARQIIKTGEDSAQRKMSSLVPPGSVAPLFDNLWDVTLAGHGLRATILINVSSQRNHARLEGWELADLMQSLYSLLRQTSFQSVRVIAFDLDRQKEVFHKESLDADGYLQLAKTLRDSDFSTISAEALKRDAWSSYLLDMTHREIQSQDVVIFFGLWGSHVRDNLSKQVLQGIADLRIHAFYLTFFHPSNEFDDDAIQKLITAFHGKTFPIYSPGSLADAIKKINLPAAPEDSK